MTKRINYDQREKFKKQLDDAAKARAKVLTNAEINMVKCEWITAYGNYTICRMQLNNVTAHGLAVRHLKDEQNEFIGHSLSFRRAFDELENKVAGTRQPIGFITTPLTKAGEMVFAGPNGELRTYRSLEGTIRHLKEHPIKPDTPFYHTGLKRSHNLGEEFDCLIVPDTRSKVNFTVDGMIVHSVVI